MPKEALFYKKLTGHRVKCALCHHHCLIAPDKNGICQVRKNKKGRLISLIFNHPIATQVDPIEKKPLFHFFPGAKSFSIATAGCNFHCDFCQNYDLSQNLYLGEKITPPEIVSQAKENQCLALAYTYTEPTIFFEYALEIAQLAHQQKIKNIFISNGYLATEPLKKIAPYLDAANIDLKSLENNFYKKYCGATLKPVLKNLKLMKKLGIFIEITTLLIPGKNDQEKNIANIARFIAQELGPEIPWHLSGFYPAFRLTEVRPTSISQLEKAYQIGKKIGLKYIYLGNQPGNNREDTICPKCHKVMIKRDRFSIIQRFDNNGQCSQCQASLNIIDK